jgi:hypothetical protein
MIRPKFVEGSNDCINRPVEMIIFADEGHIKNQPKHRYEISPPARKGFRNAHLEIIFTGPENRLLASSPRERIRASFSNKELPQEPVLVGGGNEPANKGFADLCLPAFSSITLNFLQKAR